MDSADTHTHGVVAACIPSIGKSSHLNGLLDVLVSDGVDVFLYINQAEHDLDVDALLGRPRMRVRHSPGTTIYQGWNATAAMCKELGYRFLLLCNDDIEMLPGTAAALQACLETGWWGAISVGAMEPQVDPKEAVSTDHRSGTRRGFLQWCFMVRLDAWQDVDERYQIWYGDDDLLAKMNRAGRTTGALLGVGVRHYTSTTIGQTGWVHEAAGRDGELWAREGGL